MVAAATIVSMAAAKKAQQNVIALYHSYNRTILLGFIWILDFHLKIVLVLRRRYLIPMRCNNGKRKMWPWRWLHHFDFQHWWWLHALMTTVALFRAGNFWNTYTTDPLQTNVHIGCMIDVKCDTCKNSGAYAHLDCITSTVGDIDNRYCMQVTHSYKERVFVLFPPQLKTNLWMIWHHKLKLPLSAKYKVNFSRNVNQCRAVWQIWGHSFHNARNQSDALNADRAHGCPDHWIAIRHHITVTS